MDVKVMVVPAGGDASSHLRIREPARALAELGYDISVYDASRAVEVRTLRGSVIDARTTAEADVLVLCRPQSAALVEAIPLLQAHGVAVVIDVDDDLGRVDPSNVAWSALHPGNNPRRNWSWTTALCKVADLVTVTTPALADRYGAHGRVAVLPNCIPTAELRDHRGGADLRVGWAGAVATHPRDLQVMGGAVSGALGPHALPFVVIGPEDGVARATGYPLIAATGVLPYGEWVDALATLDVGVVPLAETAFNAAKSSLKAMQYAAAGVAVLASATPDNVRVARDGVCELAERPRDWRNGLRRLVESDTLRAERAETGRAAVIERHLLEPNAWRWIEAWTTALANRRDGCLASG